jgi:hypothetical protein
MRFGKIIIDNYLSEKHPRCLISDALEMFLIKVRSQVNLQRTVIEKDFTIGLTMNELFLSYFRIDFLIIY